MYGRYCGNEIRDGEKTCSQCGRDVNLPQSGNSEKQYYVSGKNRLVAIVLTMFRFVGIGGLQRFYVARYATGIIYIITCGFFFLGTIWDLYKLINETFKDGDGYPLWADSSLKSNYHKRAVTCESIKKIVICGFIIIPILFGFISQELGHQQTPKENKKIAEDQIYQEAVGLAKNSQWKDCYLKLSSVHGNVDARALCKYAEAQDFYNKGDIYAAIDQLVWIPNKYNGEFKDDIDQLRKKCNEEKQKRAKEEEARLAKSAAERANDLYIGDSEGKITKIYGKPDKVNRTVVGNHVSKQYVYWDKDLFIYTTDGEVTGFQD